MTLKNLLIKAIVVFMISGCTDELEKKESYIIEFGISCGRCAGTEFIKITESKVEYVRNIPCGANTGVSRKEKSLSSSEWDLLLKTFDYKKFKTLGYNECHTCYDGCDEIITITFNDTLHRITYLPSKTINEIQVLQSKLNGIMTEMKTK